MTDNKIYRFKISLTGIKPMIWRRIELRDTASFWDLASAILDAMGWEGYHLFDFIIKEPGRGERFRIGIPSADFEEVIPVWEVKIRDLFTPENNSCEFIYDFGDNWQHTVKLEKILEAAEGKQYPLCTGGKRACPPEDCGGTWGYADLLRTLKDPADEEYEHVLDWVGDGFDSEYFKPGEVTFQNPINRLKQMMGGSLPDTYDSGEKKSAGKSTAGHSQKAVSLSKKLNNLRKSDLVFIAKHQGIKKPGDLKKSELVETLTQHIPEKFAEELIYFSREELMIFSYDFKDFMSAINHVLDEMQTETDFNTTEELLDHIDLLEESIMKLNTEELIPRMINKGYIFPKGEYIDENFDVPKEILETFQREKERLGDDFSKFQLLQTYAVALTSLYGVCSYNQLWKVFKKHIDPKATLKKVKDYTQRYGENCVFFETEPNYIYTSALDEVTFRTIVDADLKRDYYFPTEEDIACYCFQLCGPQVEDLFEELSKFLLKHTKIDGFSIEEDSFGGGDALSMSKSLLPEYDVLLERIMISARMGEGLNGLIENLDIAMCKANSLKALNTLYAMYLELEEKTRKWTLKGALYSDLRK